MEFLSLFGFGNSKIKEALRHGAVVIDVRTAGEFDQGKVPDSINIPVDRIAINAARIKAMKRPIIFCCSTGTRSGTATRIMKEKGLKEVYNGGGWERILKIVNSL
jgi:rhodanese-related sulfurtransferase